MLSFSPGIGFSSVQGFQITLPKMWRALPKSKTELLPGLDEIEVFADPNDPALSLTWMRSSTPVARETIERFQRATRIPGAIDASESHEIIMSCFPIMGRAVTAFSIELEDRQKALEVTELIKPQGTAAEALRAYHLLMRYSAINENYKETGNYYMQQLVFYARASVFAERIVEIIYSARSFRQN
ncbi:MAG: hypothetical protein K2X27_19230 [Candidatus Obscuribacterales bacterium]|nr:hypothetical protein [Candidatus Obscuribacterales bacterium]